MVGRTEPRRQVRGQPLRRRQGAGGARRNLSGRTPTVVVAETGANTNVSQARTPGSPAADETDTIAVRLSAAPHGGRHRALGDHGAGLVEYYDGANRVTSIVFSATATPAGSSGTRSRTLTVRAVDDGVDPRLPSHRSRCAAPGYFQYLSTILIGDNHWPGVRVIESDGSTNVVEQSLAASQVGYQSDAFVASAKLPAFDSYTVALTKAPSASVDITVVAQPTRTSQTGGIVSFAQQLELSKDGTNWFSSVTVTFGTGNWNAPQTVYVRAKQDNRVDGQDTQVFAQQLEQLNAIRGPLFVNGGEGADRAGLLEREPVMLPGERNETPAMGNVISATPGTLDNAVAATITIEHSRLGKIEISAEAGTDNNVQTIAVNAISGTFRLTYTNAWALRDRSAGVRRAGRDGGERAHRAPARRRRERRRRGRRQERDHVPGVRLGCQPITSKLGQDTAYNNAHLGPASPSQLVGITILISSGPAKNKSRIVTGGIVSGSNVDR